MVGMRQKSYPTNGHVIVVLEDETIFDSDNFLRDGDPAPQLMANDLEVTWTMLVTKVDD